jgi:hypothetical protein
MFEQALMFQLLAPPALALLFCGGMLLDSYRKSRKLTTQVSDREAYRRRMEALIGEGI